MQAETLAHGHQQRDAVKDKKGLVGADGKSPVGFSRTKASPKWVCALLLRQHVPCSL